MKIAVIGIGGVGGYFGGRLTQTPHEVIFIARGGHLAAIQAQGLHVHAEAGYFVARPNLATDDPAAIGPVDVVLVATKAWQLTEAIPQMRPLVGEQTTILPLLNGIEPVLQLAAAFGSRVLGGFCRVMSAIREPGHIHQAGIEPVVAFGELDKQLSPRVEALRALFREAGVKVDESPDIEAAMWQKFLFIASFSGVGAVTRAPIGLIRSLPQTRQMLTAAMQEILAVALARGVAMKPSAVEDALAFVDGIPAEGTASMQRDVMDGRPSELEAQNGAVTRLGAEVAVPTPTHQFIYHALLPAELKARGQR